MQVIIHSSYDFLRMLYQGEEFFQTIISEKYPNGLEFHQFLLSDQTFVYLMKTAVFIFSNIIPIMQMLMMFMSLSISNIVNTLIVVWSALTPNIGLLASLALD